MAAKRIWRASGRVLCSASCSSCTHNSSRSNQALFVSRADASASKLPMNALGPVRQSDSGSADRANESINWSYRPYSSLSRVALGWIFVHPHTFSWRLSHPCILMRQPSISTLESFLYMLYI